MSFLNPIYKTITDTVPEFFFVYDLASQEIVFVSPRFYNHVGQRPNETLHQLFQDFIHPECRADLDKFFSDLSPKNDYSACIELKAYDMRDGIEWIQLHTHAVEAENGGEVGQVVGHILDITERKSRYELLEGENEKLDNVLKILSHDLRAPFAQVYMLTNLMQEQMSAEEQQRFGNYLNMLRNLGQRSLNLLENFLKLAALQEGAKRLDFQLLDARDVVEQVARQNQLELKQRQQLLEVVVPDTAVSIKGDKLLLEQALHNLLSNAMKFTPNGHPLSIRLKLPKPGQIILEVQDSGIGIATEDLPHLFTEFTRIRRRGIRGERPVGLGLAICQQIIKLHHGTIKVESSLGKGTCFTLYIPS